ncbi:MAG: hypothetical protein ACO3L4_09440 [Candidatus Puniceispirillaceae bacterium]|jgi:hypothetical protein|nr:hypothetical protein [Alphaproteobacteria bacterium]
MAKNLKTKSAANADDKVVNRSALEQAALLLTAGFTLAALIAAIGYDFSSSRPLFVILVPLIFLVLVQIYRTMKQGDIETSLNVIKAALGGQIVDFAVSVKFFMLLMALLICIYVLGHYAGLMLAMFYLIRVHGGESMKMSLIVPIITALALFALFELVFSIELFQGQLYRYFAGYRIW